MKKGPSRWAPALVALAIVVVLGGCGGGSTRGSTSNQRAQRMSLQLTSPTARGAVTESETMVAGVASEPSATVTVNDVAVEVGSDGSFSQTVPLAYGSNRIAVRATAEGYSDATRTVTITRNLTLEVTSPAGNTSVSRNRVTVTGNVSDPAATVRVQGYLIPVNADGTFSREIQLYYPSTILAIVATVADGEPVSRTVTVAYPDAQ